MTDDDVNDHRQAFLNWLKSANEHAVLFRDLLDEFNPDAYNMAVDAAQIAWAAAISERVVSVIEEVSSNETI